jgi:hypothetical protein
VLGISTCKVKTEEKSGEQPAGKTTEQQEKKEEEERPAGE